MGMFDTIYLADECPYCHKKSRMEFQTKALDNVLDTYKKGDYTDDKYNYLPAIGACESPECRIRGSKTNLILHGEPMHSETIFDANVMLSKGIITGEVKVTGLVEKYTDEFLKDSKVKEKLVEYQTGTNLSKFRDWINENFGKRCPDYEKDCPVCKTWKLYDELKELFDTCIDVDDEIEEKTRRTTKSK